MLTKEFKLKVENWIDRIVARNVAVGVDLNNPISNSFFLLNIVDEFNKFMKKDQDFDEFAVFITNYCKEKHNIILELKNK